MPAQAVSPGQGHGSFAPALDALAQMFVVVLLKAFLTLVPMAKTAPTITAAIAATMSPYSTAEAPRSSVRRITLRR